MVETLIGYEILDETDSFVDNERTQRVEPLHLPEWLQVCNVLLHCAIKDDVLVLLKLNLAATCRSGGPVLTTSLLQLQITHTVQSIERLCLPIGYRLCDVLLDRELWVRPVAMRHPCIAHSRLQAGVGGGMTCTSLFCGGLSVRGVCQWALPLDLMPLL